MGADQELKEEPVRRSFDLNRQTEKPLPISIDEELCKSAGLRRRRFGLGHRGEIWVQAPALVHLRERDLPGWTFALGFWGYGVEPNLGRSEPGIENKGTVLGRVLGDEPERGVIGSKKLRNHIESETVQLNLL